MKINIVLTTLSVLTALLLFLCIWLSYKLIDASISYTYLEASLDSQGRNKKIYHGLLTKELVGISEAVLVEKLNWQIKNSDVELILKKEGNYVIFENLRFKIEEGEVVELLQ